MKLSSIPILLLVALITGCSSTNPKTLSPYSSPKVLVIDGDVTYTGKRGLYPFEEGLRKGTYRAELKDTAGMYFRGPGLCAFTTPSHDGRTRQYEGGLWVPNDGDLAHARIYSYFSAARFYAEEKAVTGVTVVNSQGKATTIPMVLTLPVYADDGNLYLWDKEVGSEIAGNVKWQEQQ